MLMKNMELSLKQIGTEIGVSLMACVAMLPLSLTIGSPCGAGRRTADPLDGSQRVPKAFR